MKATRLGWRERAEALWCNNRLVIVLEVLAVVVLHILHSLGVLSATVIYLFLLGWLSLWLRRQGWRQVGLRRPARWLPTIVIGVIVGLAYQAFSLGVLTPWLHQLTNEPLDLSQFAPLRSNVAVLLVWLTVAWTLAAFGEEMAYRGYLLNRIADLGRRDRAGWVIALVGSAVMFGMTHAYQGATGVLETVLFACVMTGLYWAGRGNLWLPIIAHGVYDTAAFGLIFLGLYP